MTHQVAELAERSCRHWGFNRGNRRSVLHRDRVHVAASGTINVVCEVRKCSYSFGAMSRRVVLVVRFNSTLGSKKSEMWVKGNVPHQHLSSLGVNDVARNDGNKRGTKGGRCRA